MCSPSTDSKRVQAAPLEPATFQRHRIHTMERDWAETNCYTDVMIEMLHGFGMIADVRRRHENALSGIRGAKRLGGAEVDDHPG